MELAEGKVTIAVCTYGDLPYWSEMALRRATPSARAQGEHICMRAHGDTLHDCRNRALYACETEWIIFLDADDELAPGYVDAMLKGSADLRAPAVEYVRGGVPRPPYVPTVAGHEHHACTADCMPFGNWLVIGSMARTRILQRIGGFMDWPVYEDWCLWWRAVRAGATVEAIPEAVYTAYVRDASRNRVMPIEERNVWHHKIVDSITARDDLGGLEVHA